MKDINEEAIRYDKNGNEIYYRDSKYECYSEYDEDGNETFYSDNVGIKTSTYYNVKPNSIQVYNTYENGNILYTQFNSDKYTCINYHADKKSIHISSNQNNIGVVSIEHRTIIPFIFKDDVVVETRF